MIRWFSNICHQYVVVSPKNFILLCLALSIFNSVYLNCALWSATTSDETARPYAIEVKIDTPTLPIEKTASVERMDSPIDSTQTTTAYHKNNKFLLGCEEIATLQIVRKMGKGYQKSVFEVVLPWGEHALVKRCWASTCVANEWLKKEANLTRELYEQYGDRVVGYFGECDLPYAGTTTRELKEQKHDFSAGFSLVVELGRPLVARWGGWDMNDTECFAEFFTDTDVEDFVNIARMFASFSKYPLLLNTPVKNDNIYPQQYMATIGGSKEGRIKLLDLDFLGTCKDGETFRKRTNIELVRFGIERENCTFETVLNVNCRIMAELTNIPNLNCSLPIGSSLTTKHVPHVPNYHINVSQAVIECTGRRNITDNAHLLS